jgi:hypothetical protein
VSNKKQGKKDKKESQLVGFLGVGLDNQDGHHRITRSEYFLLLGGSPDTHERMQNTAIHFTEDLQRRGKTLQSVKLEEVIDLLHEANEKAS